MESKENKQKTQAAEEQVSCPPQQPMEPHPFISVIPLAVLITLIVMVVKLFPDDALAGASHDSHSSMRGTRHGNLQYEMEYLRGDDQKDRGRCRGIYSDSAAHRNDVSYLDDQWRGSHINILWCSDHVADLFPTLRLHHLQHHFCDDGNLMDHHCHHRYCPDGNR